MASNVTKTAKRLTWRKAKFTCKKTLKKLTQDVLKDLNISGLYLTGTEDATTKMKIEVSILLHLLDIYGVMPDIYWH